MKKVISQVPNCRNPQEFNNPIKIIRFLLEKEDKNGKTKPPKREKKVIY